MRRTNLRRIATLVAGALLLGALLPAVVAAAETERETIFFDYIKDRRAWFWEKQIDQEVRLPVPRPPALPPEVPTPSQRVRLPNPQQPDTLPVAAYGGEEERVSAIAFNLADRGVTEGSTIEKLVMKIEESEDRNEWPSFNVDAAKIQACRITEFWVSADDPETMTARPETTSDCVTGRRNPDADPPVWTFDLTDIAAPWGESSFSNQGVLLSPELPDDAGAEDTWQVNLKIPSHDREASPLQPDPPTYEKTKRRVVVQLEFVPGEPPVLPTPDPLPTGTSTTTLNPGTSSGTPYGTTGAAVGSVTTGGTTAPPPPPPQEETPAPAPAAAPIAQTEPAVPAYVWLLLPLGLLALSAVRSVVLEPTGGPRPDGAIAAIRRRNAARRGGPIREIRDPLATAWGAARRGAGRTGATITKALRKVRRR